MANAAAVTSTVPQRTSITHHPTFGPPGWFFTGVVRDHPGRRDPKLRRSDSQGR